MEDLALQREALAGGGERLHRGQVRPLRRAREKEQVQALRLLRRGRERIGCRRSLELSEREDQHPRLEAIPLRGACLSRRSSAGRSSSGLRKIALPLWMSVRTPAPSSRSMSSFRSFIGTMWRPPMLMRRNSAMPAFMDSPVYTRPATPCPSRA
jgi:hypothetical protein